jgi:hypothetical protein
MNAKPLQTTTENQRREDLAPLSQGEDAAATDRREARNRAVTSWENYQAVDITLRHRLFRRF